MEAIRELARLENCTLSELVNRLLAEGIQRRTAGATGKRFELPTFAMGRPRVNLGDRNALEALMDS